MNKEILKKITDGEATIEDIVPPLIFIKVESDDPIPPNTPLSDNLVKFLIEHCGDGLPGPMVCKYENGKIDLL